MCGGGGGGGGQLPSLPPFSYPSDFLVAGISAAIHSKAALIGTGNGYLGSVKSTPFHSILSSSTIFLRQELMLCFGLFPTYDIHRKKLQEPRKIH